MTMPASMPAAATEQRASVDQVLRMIVALVGLIEGLGGLTDLPTLFGNLAKAPGFSVAGLLIIASIALHPLAGFGALGFAVAKRLRSGIVALAVLAFAEWASEMPPVLRDGIGISAGDDAFVTGLLLFKIFIQPLIGAAAIVACWRSRHLAAATVAVMLPTLIDAAGIAAFAISVSLYGF